MLPLVGFTSRRITLPVVVLPLPLSPASARISPLRMLKLIPSTALTFSSFLESRVSKNPRRRGYHFLRFSTRTTSSLLVSGFEEGSDGFWFSMMTGSVQVAGCGVVFLSVLFEWRVH